MQQVDGRLFQRERAEITDKNCLFSPICYLLRTRHTGVDKFLVWKSDPGWGTDLGWEADKGVGGVIF